MRIPIDCACMDHAPKAAASQERSPCRVVAAQASAERARERLASEPRIQQLLWAPQGNADGRMALTASTRQLGTTRMGETCPGSGAALRCLHYTLTSVAYLLELPGALQCTLRARPPSTQALRSLQRPAWPWQQLHALRCSMQHSQRSLRPGGSAAPPACTWRRRPAAAARPSVACLTSSSPTGRVS